MGLISQVWIIGNPLPCHCEECSPDNLDLGHLLAARVSPNTISHTDGGGPRGRVKMLLPELGDVRAWPAEPLTSPLLPCSPKSCFMPCVFYKHFPSEMPPTWSSWEIPSSSFIKVVQARHPPSVIWYASLCPILCPLSLQRCAKSSLHSRSVVGTCSSVNVRCA